MTQIAYSGLFWTQFRVSRDLFTDLTAGKATVPTVLPRLPTATSRIPSCTYRRIITYQTPQSNLLSDCASWRTTPNTALEVMDAIQSNCLVVNFVRINAWSEVQRTMEHLCASTVDGVHCTLHIWGMFSSLFSSSHTTHWRYWSLTRICPCAEGYRSRCYNTEMVSTVYSM